MNQTRLIGVLISLVGAIIFSTKSILVKLAYRHDVDSLSLLALRMLFALPLYMIIGSWANRKSKQNNPLHRKDIIAIFLIGVIGYYLASWFDFVGLQYISAGLERTILFLYPTLVVLLSALFFRQKITPIILLALVLSYSGIGIAFLDKSVANSGAYFHFGVGMVFLASFAYALYVIGSGQFLSKVGTLRFTSLSMGFAALAVLMHHGLAQGLQLWHFSTEVYLLALAMAIFPTVVSSFLISEGIRRIGASRASIVASIGPISTIIMAYFFLGENFGWWQMGGTVLVIFGVMIISVRK